ERFQVRAGDAGAAVEHEERRPCTAADDAIPDSSSRDLHVAFARGEALRTAACAWQHQTAVYGEPTSGSTYHWVPPPPTSCSIRRNRGSCRTLSHSGLCSPHMPQALRETRSR